MSYRFALLSSVGNFGFRIIIGPQSVAGLFRILPVTKNISTFCVLFAEKPKVLENLKYRPVKDLQELEGNPRYIKDDQFKKLVTSIEQNPDYFEARPLILSNRTGKLVVIAGNQRLRAAKELNLKEVPTYLIENLTPAKEREIIIRDNVNNGQWDYDVLANEWDHEQLEKWGMDLPGFELDPEELDENFSLPDGDKDSFKQITFILSNEQADTIKKALEEVKEREGVEALETMGNENSNGNAIYYIVQQWVELKK